MATVSLGSTPSYGGSLRTSGSTTMSGVGAWISSYPSAPVPTGFKSKLKESDRYPESYDKQGRCYNCNHLTNKHRSRVAYDEEMEYTTSGAMVYYGRLEFTPSCGTYECEHCEMEDSLYGPTPFYGSGATSAGTSLASSSMMSWATGTTTPAVRTHAKITGFSGGTTEVVPDMGKLFREMAKKLGYVKAPKKIKATKARK